MRVIAMHSLIEARLFDFASSLLFNTTSGRPSGVKLSAAPTALRKPLEHEETSGERDSQNH